MVCREHPVASHFSGSKNILSDALSKGKHHHSTEWSMHKVTVVLIFEHWLTPHVNLFAFKKNQVFFSAGPSPTSSGLNAFTQKWEHLYGYAFLPFSLIPRVLRKQVAALSPDPINSAVSAQSTVVTSADEHAGEHGDGPPTGDPAAGQPHEELGHGIVLPHAGYLYGLPPRILWWPRVFTRGCWHGSQSPARIDLPGISHILHYLRWCVERSVAPAQAPLTQVAEFLNGLRTVQHRDKPLALRTKAGYRSAIAGVYRVFPDGSMVSSNVDHLTLLKGIFVVASRPIHKTLTETWDLTTVLKYLKIASTGHFKNAIMTLLND